jgi:hypothetical protein
MTRHEKLSLGASITALVIAIVSPFLNYYWFQSEVRIRQLKSEAFRVEGNAYGCPDLRTVIFEIWLKNTGAWPIENVRLIIEKTVYTINLNQTKYKADNLVQFSFDVKDIKPYPPLNISVEEKRNHDIVVRFKDPLPPNSDVMLGTLQFKNVEPDYIYMLPDFESMQPSVWVSSEVSSFDLPWSITVDCSTVKRLRQQYVR